MNIDEESGQVDAVEMLPSQSEGSGIFGRIENQDGPLVGDVIPIEEGEPWAQLDDEEGKWYNIFVRYYLPLGISRSVRAAYRAFCEIEKPQILTKEGKLPYTATPHYWLSISRRWDWVERAQAFDRALNRQVLNSVELAHEILVDAAPEAAEALLKAMNNARTRVQAANSVLDRVGLPSVHRQESVSVRITADDVRKAQQEAKEWEKKNFNKSG